MNSRKGKVTITLWATKQQTKDMKEAIEQNDKPEASKIFEEIYEEGEVNCK